MFFLFFFFFKFPLDRLRFTNVIASDAMDGMPYRCLAINEIMRLNRQGPPQIIEPQSRSRAVEREMPFGPKFSSRRARV